MPDRCKAKVRDKCRIRVRCQSDAKQRSETVRCKARVRDKVSDVDAES